MKKDKKEKQKIKINMVFFQQLLITGGKDNVYCFKS